MSELKRTVKLDERDLYFLELYLENNKMLNDQMLQHKTIDEDEHVASDLERKRIEMLVLGKTIEQQKDYL